MVASGALEGEPVELVDGLLVHVSPQGPEHAALVQWLTARLAGRADLLRVQLPLAVPGGRPEPDLALAESRGAHAHPDTADLVIEIAVTSHAEDAAKLPGYARAGVDAVWLIDVPARTVHVHEDPSAGAYRATHLVAAGGVLRAPVEGIEAIPVAELFAVLDR